MHVTYAQRMDGFLAQNFSLAFLLAGLERSYEYDDSNDHRGHDGGGGRDDDVIQLSAGSGSDSFGSDLAAQLVGNVAWCDVDSEVRRCQAVAGAARAKYRAGALTQTWTTT